MKFTTTAPYTHAPPPGLPPSGKIQSTGAYAGQRSVVHLGGRVVAVGGEERQGEADDVRPRLRLQLVQPGCPRTTPGNRAGSDTSNGASNLSVSGCFIHILCTHKCTHRPLAGWCTLALEGLGWAGAAPVSRAPEGGVVATWHGIGLAEVRHAGHTHGHDQLAPRQLLVVQQRRPAGGDTRQEGRASVAGANGAGHGEERAC